MAMSADHRNMPLGTPATDGELPTGMSTPNLFAPISTANRITGNSRVHRARAMEQLTPGSAYDYGRMTYDPSDAADSNGSADSALPDRMPPTFLRRTMLPLTHAEPEAAVGYGLQSQPAPETLEQAYRQSLVQPKATEPWGGGTERIPPVTAAPLSAEHVDARNFRAGQEPLPGNAYPAARAGYPSAVTAYPPVNVPAAAPVTPAWEGSATGRYQRSANIQPPEAFAFPNALNPTVDGSAPRRYSGASPMVQAFSGESASPQQHAGIPTKPPAFAVDALAPQPYTTVSPARQAFSGDAYAPPQYASVSPTPQALSSDMPAPRARRAARNAAATPYAPDVPLPADYLPKHGGAPAAQGADADELGESPVDVWEALGWKAPEPMGFENTAVLRLSDLTMFERDAFGEPPDPLRDPANWRAEPTLPMGDAYAPAQAPMMGEVMPQTAYPGPYSPYALQDSDAYPPMDAPPVAGYAPYQPYDPQGFSVPEESEPMTDARARRGEPSPRSSEYMPESSSERPKGEGSWLSLRALGPWRTAVIVVASLALLFSLMEGYRMLQSLWVNEKSARDYLAEYRDLTGSDSSQAVSGVELLPAGVTFAPTATPEVIVTPTPKPRIDQNDPLIGVLDSGGNAQTHQQPALPTATPPVRTRLTQYANNALLDISDAFAALREENSDVVGRLVIDGVLDEVLVQHDNTYYLNHNARGLIGASGAIFVDESCSLKTPPENLLIRGQANAAGKLFEPLLQYEIQGNAFVESHGILRCDTIYEQAQYVVFAVLRADSVTNSPAYFNYAGYPTFQSDGQMMNYVEAARQKSKPRINVSVRPDDRLLTIATLAEGSDTTSLVLLCRMLRNGETPSNIQRN